MSIQVVVADLVVKRSLLELNLLLLNCLTIRVLLFIHPSQQILSFLLVDFVHLIVNLAKAADYIVNGADYLRGRLYILSGSPITT
jgi:hypothetical protein